MNDITRIFDDMLQQHRSIDIAEAEFKKLIHEDENMREEYREWCDAVGSSEKNGFRDYCEEYIKSQDSIWDTLNDYDQE